ncbi:MAG: hypothetical protein N2482_00410 [Patescibacteria group bacterium]|nr:hypothetical protein [Patescibacteria group bacterium]
MIKKLTNFFLINFLIFVFLFFCFSVFAEEVKEVQRIVCLKSIRCDQKNAVCSGKGKAVHRAKLIPDSIQPLLNNETYIIVCVGLGAEQICTTGNKETDIRVYGQDQKDLMNNKNLNYQFQGLFSADGTTSLNNPIIFHQPDFKEVGGWLEWQDSTNVSKERKFFALNYYDKNNLPEGNDKALKQGTINFDIVEKDCVSVRWDPYGVVFDSQTLEPVLGAEVSLWKKKGNDFILVNKNDILGGNIINPQITLEDGQFSFVVPDDDYKLIVSYNNYRFPNQGEPHPNWQKIYSDLYPNKTGEVIYQRGNIIHRDIPIDPLGASIQREPNLMESFYSSRPLKKEIVIEGRVSHPLTKIIAYSQKMINGQFNQLVRYRQLKQIITDEKGRFNLVIDQTDFEKNKEFIEVFGELVLEKTDLRQLSENKTNNWWLRLISFFLPKKIYAQMSSIRFEPILSYIEGYAYDTNHKVIPNATVGVYLKFSNKPYYETKADEKGYFKISSEHLPFMAYELRYNTLTGKVYKSSTLKFINDNQDYLVNNNINLYTSKNEKEQIQPTPSSILTTISQWKVSGQGTLERKKTPSTFLSTKKPLVKNTEKGNIVSNTNNNYLIAILGIIVFLITGVAGLLIFYLKRKKETEISSTI